MKRLKDPKAVKYRILSLLMINPGYEFTTEEIFRLALGQNGYNVFYHSDIQTSIRNSIRDLRKDGYPIDSVDDLVDRRRRYFYNASNFKHHLAFKDGMDIKLNI